MFRNEFLKALWNEYQLSPSFIAEANLRQFDAELNNYLKNSPKSTVDFILLKSDSTASSGIAKAEKTNSLDINEIRYLMKILNDERFENFDWKKHKKIILGELNVPDNNDGYFKERDILEFINIFLVFKKINKNNFFMSFKSLDLKTLLLLHKELTNNLDMYDFGWKVTKLPNYYKPGKLRKENNVQVGSYNPIESKEIIPALDELLPFANNIRTTKDLWFFVNALYAIHPFHNGNKRVCRILEHGLLRSLGFNSMGAYNLANIYFDYFEESRKNDEKLSKFEKTLLMGLETHDMSLMAELQSNSMLHAISSAFLVGIEKNRSKFLETFKSPSLGLSQSSLLNILSKYLVKIKAVPTSLLVEKTMNLQISERSVYNSLDFFAKKGLIRKRKIGREVFWILNADGGCFEEKLKNIYSTENPLELNPSFCIERIQKSILLKNEMRNISADIYFSPRLLVDNGMKR